jgi:hypothetical protein
MLSELTASTRRLALVGLAKNTGKTVALTTLLRELEAAGRRVGVTSVGRDGEERDVIDARIEKPRVLLAPGSLVATTDGLLRASGIPYELLEDPDIRTPLGRVLIARVNAGPPGPAGAPASRAHPEEGRLAIEVAGPSAAADVRAVADAMLAHGAEQVLIDGAIDRRAASSPDVADGLIVATGAVLDRDIEEVVSQTRDAVELVRLPSVDDGSDAGRRLRELAERAGSDAPSNGSRPSLLVGEDLEPVALPPRFVLTAEGEQIAQLLDENPSARWLIIAGALPEQFLRSLVHPVHRRGRELVLVVADPTRVFLSKRGPEWYRRQGILLRTLKRIELEAITVNPLAPQSHSFDSAQLRGLLEAAIPDVPVFDVLHADYSRRSLASR